MHFYLVKVFLYSKIEVCSIFSASEVKVFVVSIICLKLGLEVFR
jgi:hypothetical protein